MYERIGGRTTDSVFRRGIALFNVVQESFESRMAPVSDCVTSRVIVYGSGIRQPRENRVMELDGNPFCLPLIFGAEFVCKLLDGDDIVRCVSKVRECIPTVLVGEQGE